MAKKNAMVRPTGQDDEAAWGRFWQYDRVASCMDGPNRKNYDERTATEWRKFFTSLPGPTKILDLCTGNGAIALLASQTGRSDGKGFHVVAVDQAQIDPPKFVTRYIEDLKKIEFRGGLRVEELPFSDSEFGAVVSQFGIEYSDLALAIPEALRVIVGGGRFRFVVHAQEGVVHEEAQAAIRETDFLLNEVDLPAATARCIESVVAVERDPNPSEDALAAADTAFAAFTAALEKTMGFASTARDQAMIVEVVNILFDTHSNRGYFELPELLAKVEDVRGEILAHRARTKFLTNAAITRDRADKLADQLKSLGASEAAAGEIRDADGSLIAYVLEGKKA